MSSWPVLLLAIVAGASADLPPLPGWVVVLDENFDGTSLNSSLWEARDMQSHCCPAELQVGSLCLLVVGATNC